MVYTQRHINYYVCHLAGAERLNETGVRGIRERETKPFG